MRGMKSILFLFFIVVVSVLLIGGCNNQRTAPAMGFGDVSVETKLVRDDVVVLERVQGTSETQSILFGAVQIIDGKKVKIGPIPFFTEEFTCLYDPQKEFRPLGCLLPETKERAYYKALEATPEADAVFYKTWKQEMRGIPLLWETNKVTFSGKAFTVKPDQPESRSEPETTTDTDTD